jgi:hypothetical protein
MLHLGRMSVAWLRRVAAHTAYQSVVLPPN